MVQVVGTYVYRPGVGPRFRKLKRRKLELGLKRTPLMPKVYKETFSIYFQTSNEWVYPLTLSTTTLSFFFSGCLFFGGILTIFFCDFKGWLKQLKVIKKVCACHLDDGMSNPPLKWEIPSRIGNLEHNHNHHNQQFIIKFIYYQYFGKLWFYKRLGRNRIKVWKRVVECCYP